MSQSSQKKARRIDNESGILDATTAASLKDGLTIKTKNKIKYFLVSKKWVSLNRPHFGAAANKSSRGRSLLIAGSKEYLGAGVLATRACLRAGSGYAMLAHAHPPVLALKNPDFIVVDLAKKKISDLKFDAVAIGPGLGVNKKTKSWIQQLIKMNMQNVVVDADAITVCVQEKLFPLPVSWVATPHAGELARVLDVSAQKIQADRLHYAGLGQKKMGCQVLLKGHQSILASGKNLFVIPTGNEALAKSGTGDVLTGMITAFVAQGLNAGRAALVGAFIHGAVADDWIRDRNDAASFIASELIQNLPKTLLRF